MTETSTGSMHGFEVRVNSLPGGDEGKAGPGHRPDGHVDSISVGWPQRRDLYAAEVYLRPITQDLVRDDAY